MFKTNTHTQIHIYYLFCITQNRINCDSKSTENKFDNKTKTKQHKNQNKKEQHLQTLSKNNTMT